MDLLIAWFPFQDTQATETEWLSLEIGWTMKLRKPGSREVDKEPQSSWKDIVKATEEMTALVEKASS